MEANLYNALIKISTYSDYLQYIENIVDSTSWTCGDIEDTHHFLFVCYLFTYLRRDLINSVSDICQPNLNVLLCGDLSLSLDQHADI